MILYIQILLVLLLIAFPIIRHVMKARVDFTLGLAFMLGVEWLVTEVIIKDTLFDKTELTFSFGPINVTGTWLKKTGDVIN